jgi:methionyl-tRNA formyltransferase
LKALRLIFMGTPDFSVAALDALVAAGHSICAVYTQPPRPAGRRGLALTRSAVHERGLALGLPVLTPERLRDAADQQKLRDFNADAAVVVAYGLLLPRPVLDAPRLGCFNIHASLLPRWRGAAPIHRAVMAGDTETGVMVMRMEEGLDTGPIALTARLPIGGTTTTGELHDRLAQAGGALIVEAMARLDSGTLQTVPQAATGVTYAHKIDKAETRIDWSQNAETVHNHIRGLSPWPGAWCEMAFSTGGAHSVERVKILASRLASAANEPLTKACGQGHVAITHLQRAGGKPVDAATFLRGATHVVIT